MIITFPSLYPDNAMPSFEFTEDSPLDSATKVKIIKVCMTLWLVYIIFPLKWNSCAWITKLNYIIPDTSWQSGIFYKEQWTMFRAMFK